MIWLLLWFFFALFAGLVIGSALTYGKGPKDD